MLQRETGSSCLGNDETHNLESFRRREKARGSSSRIRLFPRFNSARFRFSEKHVAEILVMRLLLRVLQDGKRVGVTVVTFCTLVQEAYSQYLESRHVFERITDIIDSVFLQFSAGAFEMRQKEE